MMQVVYRFLMSRYVERLFSQHDFEQIASSPALRMARWIRANRKHGGER